MRHGVKLSGTHKDRPPQSTVSTIRRILEGIGVQPIEAGWQLFSERCLSLRLMDPLFPAAATNGKGIDRPLALASAYGEFAERLQNGMLYDNGYGLMSEGGYFTPDARRVRSRELLATIRERCASTMDGSEEAVVALLGEEAACVPFWNVQTRETAYLPWEAICRSAGSNGMCAGNTPEEALLQGLCEICERYAVREIYRTAPPLPTISHRAVSGYPIHDEIDKLEAAGFHVLLKDCSLGGRLPVVAMILLDRSRTRYRIAFGSDPLLETALERCMTEVAQGYSSDEIEGYLTPLDPSADLPGSAGSPFDRDDEVRAFELERQMISGVGQVPSTLFLDRGRPRTAAAFERSFASHARSLRRLAGRVVSLGFPIWVRDVSFLGFPSYQLYVPGMSEISFIDTSRARDAGRDLRQVRHCLLGLAEAEPAALLECMDTLRSMRSRPLLAARLSLLESTDWLSFLTGVALDDASDFRCHAEIIFASMYHRAGDYRRAAEELARLVATGTALADLDPPAYTLACLMYFRLRGEGVDEPLLRRSLASVFGHEVAAMVAKDLRRPEDAFRSLKLPRCGDCSRCPVRHQCRFPRWKEVGEAFARAARVPPLPEAGIPALRL